MTESIHPDTAKHLEFILGIVARLANNSVLMKGWALTAAGAVYTFAAQRASWPLALIGLIPIVGFYWLDAYYLRQERLFRCLYEAVRQGVVDPFLMDHSPYRMNKNCTWPATLRSLTLAGFYGFLAGAGVLITTVLLTTSAPASKASTTESPSTPASTSSLQSPAPSAEIPSPEATNSPSNPPSNEGPRANESGKPSATPPRQTSE